MTMTLDGTLGITATGQSTIPTINLTGGQITFPATQSASADANTLDDYEEGTWTPTYSLGSGSASFTNQIATYTKIGKVVTISLRFAVAAASSAANLQIGGLPFAFENTNSDSSGIFRENQVSGNFYGLTFGSSTAINMFRYDNTNSLPNGAPAFSGTLVYQTST